MRPPISRAEAVNALKDLLEAADRKSLQGCAHPATHDQTDKNIVAEIGKTFKLMTNTSLTTDELQLILSTYE